VTEHKANISDSVVAVALVQLTPLVKGAKPEVTLEDSSDTATVKEALVLLQGGGHYLDCGEIVAWAASNGWRSDAANELGDFAARLNAGRSLRTSKQPRLRNGTLEQWRSDAGWSAPQRRVSRSW
jgi:hypothetical protein